MERSTLAGSVTAFFCLGFRGRLEGLPGDRNRIFHNPENLTSGDH